MSLPNRTQLGPYEIVGPLGAGGMGEVYRARDSRLGREVAVKVLPERLSDDKKALLRFEREAQAVAALTHPSILTLHDVGQHEKSPYVVMELLEGETLAERIERGPLNLAEVLEISLAVAKGLAAAHGKGIIHRDVKPSNIFLTTDGQAKILDFGIARIDPMHRATEVDAPHPVTAATATGHVIGTLAYMSPEQLNSQEVDGRSDQFSFGCVIYEMLTSEHPFARENLMATMLAVVKDPAPNLAERAPDAPPELVAIVERCLAKNVDERFETTRELVYELSQLWGTTSTTLTRSWDRPLPHRRGRRWVAALAVAGVLGLAAALAVSTGFLPLGTPSAEARTRTSAAVLGFQNLSPDAEASRWMSTALAEMLSVELAGGGLRMIPGENVALALSELDLAAGGGLGPESLEKVRRGLNADLVLGGSYLVLQDEVRIQLELRKTRDGSTLAQISKKGPEDELLQLVDGLGRELRRALGGSAAAAATAVGTSMPRGTEAARLYAQGLERLRTFAPLEARDLLVEAVEAEPDFPLSHLALAEAWKTLGYDARAKEEALRAEELAQDLPLEERLTIEGLSQSLSGRWDEAVGAYEHLWKFRQDNVEYGLHLAQAQVDGGQIQQALETIEELRGLPPPSGEDPRIDLVEAAAAEALSDLDRALEVARQAVAKGEELGLRHLVAEARFAEGYALWLLSRLSQAMDRFSEAERLWGQLGDSARQARALQLIGVVQRDLGEFDRSRQTLEAALEVHRGIGTREGISLTLNSLAETRRQMGDLETALSELEASIATARDTGRKDLEATGLNALGFVYFDLGDLRSAEEAMVRSLNFFEEAEYQRGVTWAIYGLGLISLGAGDLPAAERDLAQAFEACQEQQGKKVCTQVQMALGWAAQIRGEASAAREHYDRALEIAEESSVVGSIAEARWRLADLALGRGDAAEAETLARQAEDAFAAQGRPLHRAAALAVAARALELLGRLDEARAKADEAWRLAAECGHLWIRADVIEASAFLDRSSGARAAAREDLERLRRRLAEKGMLAREARLHLAMAEIDLAEGVSGARENLERLAAEAETRGFGAVAERARALLRS